MGPSRLGILVRVHPAALAPALTAVATSCSSVLERFMWPLIVTNSDATRTLPVGLAASLGGNVAAGRSPTTESNGGSVLAYGTAL